MSDREKALAVIIGALLVFGWCPRADRSDALERAETAEAAIPAIAAQRDAARRAADSLARAAAISDSVARAAVDSAAAVSARASVSLAENRREVRVLVQDSTALRLLDQRDSIFAEELAAKDTVIAAQAVQIQQRDSEILSLREAVQAGDRRDSLRVAVNDALRDRIAELDRPNWKRDAGLVLAGAGLCALLCPR